jgi:hypothetical protein
MAPGRGRTDARVRRLERAIEAALEPGHFIGWRSSSAFVSGLEDAAAAIEPLIQSAPAEATELFDAFLAGCIEKAEEIDDSGGDLGRFAKDLVCGWVRARQATRADPDETARLLLARYDDDPYGFLYEAEEDLAKALDRPGLAAFERIVRSRWEETSAAPDRGMPGRELAWRDVLKTIYAAQRDAKRYADVCERTETAPGDCERLARMASARGKPGEALAWTERGLAIEKGSRLGTAAGVALAELRRRLLVKLGRPEDARAAAWTEFVDHPGALSHRDLMRHVPKADRASWHSRAMEVADSADLGEAIGLWLETGEIDRLADRLRRAPARALKGLSHYVTEPAAGRLAKTHPDVAATVYAALGLRILEAGKSRYYGAALEHLADARRCYRAIQDQGAWEGLLAAVRRDHRRKTGFLAALEERLVRAERPGQSWLERARKRWTSRA